MDLQTFQSIIDTRAIEIASSAKALIEEHRDIYTAVAECGFVDLAHLNKHFKSVYGTTALEYISHMN